jgi:proteasome lid subunit RPN8/RPN11
MLGIAREQHPREVIFLLRGKVERETIHIDDSLFPPMAVHGRSFAEFPLHMLPIDFSIIGTAHSHPSGAPTPSITDLNHFYSRIMIILSYPYTLMQAASYNARGEKIPLIPSY